MFSFTRKPGVFLLFGQGALRNPHFLFHLNSIPNAVNGIPCEILLRNRFLNLTIPSG